MRLPFTTPRSLRILTWNVWFGLEKPKRRWTELLAIVRRLRPDIIAFQEVTEPFLGMLRKEPWVRKSYTISDSRSETIQGYGNVVMASTQLHDVGVHDLPSDMDRKLVTARTTVAGSEWVIGSVHLDSFEESASIRGRQLERIFEVMAPFRNAAVLGDFNFCSSWTHENERIPSEWVDVWPAVRSDSGFTVDTSINTMRFRDRQKETRARIDRILVRSPLTVPQKARIVGTKRIRGEQPELFPSDHFGVFARLGLRPSGAEPPNRPE